MKRDDFPRIDLHLDIDAYHSDRDSISKTGLDLIDKAPAIFRAWQSPDAPPRVTKPGQLEGSLAHCAILEPDEFSKRYVVGPAVSRATKEWKVFEADLAPGIVGIKPDQYAVAMRQAESVRKIAQIDELLSSGRPEVSAFWLDPETGVKCRCRPDWNHPCGDSGVILGDVKTFSDVSAHEFSRQVARKAYAKQDGFYSDGFQIASDLEVLAFIFIAVSMDYPYPAAAYMLDDASKDAGRRHYHRNLNTYAECLKSGVWPGYSQEVEIISLPQWALNQE
jgi:exodeoxyribonuclease VIII